MNFLSPDGKLFNFLTKTGEIILLNLLWLIGCIPIVTIIPASTSFYYAMMKCVRKDRSQPVREYFSSFKRTLKKGIVVELLIGLWGTILLTGRSIVICNLNEDFSLLLFVYDVLLVLTAMFIVIFIPVFSRFQLNIINLFRLTFVIVCRYCYLAAVILIMFIAAFFLMYRFMPMVFICLIPGVVVYLSTFPAELAMRKYIPKMPEDVDAWYLPEEKANHKND